MSVSARGGFDEPIVARVAVEQQFKGATRPYLVVEAPAPSVNCGHELLIQGGQHLLALHEEDGVSTVLSCWSFPLGGERNAGPGFFETLNAEAPPTTFVRGHPPGAGILAAYILGSLAVLAALVVSDFRHEGTDP
jgi:hypothetical protein